MCNYVVLRSEIRLIESLTSYDLEPAFLFTSKKSFQFLLIFFPYFYTFLFIVFSSHSATNLSSFQLPTRLIRQF